MTSTDLKRALAEWQRHNDLVRHSTTVNPNETEATKRARIKRALNDYAFFVQYYFPHFCTDATTGKIIPSAHFHLNAAETILKYHNLRAVFQWARGHAKSTHMDIFIPLWLKAQSSPAGAVHGDNGGASSSPLRGDGGAWDGGASFNVMVLVGKSEDNAQTLLADVQSELQYNERYIHDFGKQYDAGHWLDGEFVTKDGCAFFARGRGQSPRGLRFRDKRPDYIIIDDLDDDELCQNEQRVQKLTDWVKEALFGTLGASGGRFIMVGNLISRTSVLANISQIVSNARTPLRGNGGASSPLRGDGGAFYLLSKVNIYDNNGNPSWPQFWTKERIEDRRTFMGYRAFQKEYMNNPLIEGSIFLQKYIRFGNMLPLHHYRQLICYTDPSFKNSATSDYKATMLVGLTPVSSPAGAVHGDNGGASSPLRGDGGAFHLLKAFAAQCSVSDMVNWHYEIYNYIRGQVPTLYYMEANFMQDLMLDEFTKTGHERGYHVPVIGDKRSKGDKFSRIETLQPLFERGLIIFNEQERNSPGMQVLIEQLLAFQRGSRSHDDAPDALESAIWLLSQRQRITQNRFVFQPRHTRRW